MINNYFIYECIEENNLLEISDKLIAEYSNENKLISKSFQIRISVCAQYYMEEEEEPELEDEFEEPVDEEETAPVAVSEPYKTDQCVVCLSKEPELLFMDCLHRYVFLECEKTSPFHKCPSCRTLISIKVKI